MSSAQFNAGQTQGQAQGKTEEWMESIKGTANAAHDKACDVAGNTQGQAQRSKEENTAFLQQGDNLLIYHITGLGKGEQMAHMAQDAIDGMKNTLGMGNKK